MLMGNGHDTVEITYSVEKRLLRADSRHSAVNDL